MTLPTIASGTGNTLSIDPSTSQTVSMAQTSANTFTVLPALALSLTSGTLNASTASTVLDMTSMTQPTLSMRVVLWVATYQALICRAVLCKSTPQRL